ncbi:hypothetical protein [Thermogymnomonas acidicola]|uniref:hypothetical protein n=1 Tax=Thermogymnomonas acidicola TaxID=399579 RepID=UPI001396ADAE|nr:hypothetical protein [Thermogymnomonas acidicola]
MYQFQTQSEGVHIKLQRGGRYTPPLIASVTIYVALAALSYVFVGDRSPRPLSPPLTTVVDWASWYSVIVAFPILTALSTLPFVGNRSAYIIVPVALITPPTYLVLYSFFLVYGLPPLGLLLFVIPLAALVPAFIILSVYAVPLIMALTASANVERSEVGMRRMPSWFYFTIIGGVAVGLTIIDIVSRYLALGGKDPSSLISVVSDVGWAAQVGARDLIHGINPYAAKLPPWGGPAPPLSYGPWSSSSWPPRSHPPCP